MWKRLAGTSAAAALATVAALGMPVAVHAAASPAVAHRSCTWSTSYWTKNGPPGAAQVTMNSISPSKCEFYRMTIQSTMFPNLRYHSGWIGCAGCVSYIDTTHNPGDGSTLKFAWEDRETAAQHSAGSTSWQCRGLFPVGAWTTCSTDAAVRWLTKVHRVMRAVVA